MRMTLILEIEFDGEGHDSGTPYDIVESIRKLEGKEHIKIVDALYKFESKYSPNELTRIERED
jgi:hypothetical protein